MSTEDKRAVEGFGLVVSQLQATYTYMVNLQSRLELAERTLKMLLLASPTLKLPINVSLATEATRSDLYIEYGGSQVELTVALHDDSSLPQTKEEL